jgi:hypothetical protein
VALTQNTDDYYPWWYSPKTATTIIHGGTRQFLFAWLFVFCLFVCLFVCFYC